MKQALLRKILAKKGKESVLEYLCQSISGSELNSLLMEVFQLKSKQSSPASLLQNYITNRFVSPSSLNVLAFRKFETSIMEFVAKNGFEFMEYAPLCPLGTCSVLAPVSQHKVVSASRGTEVLSDITNVMALEAAKRKKQQLGLVNIKLAGAHQMVRAQQINVEGFTPHFKILGLVESGRDTGSYSFEINSMANMLNLFWELMTEAMQVNKEQLKFVVSLQSPEQQIVNLANNIIRQLTDGQAQIETEIQEGNNYYQLLRVKLYYNHHGEYCDIADCGFVDWTQQLLQNKKERLLIGGLGTEFLYKLLHS